MLHSLISYVVIFIHPDYVAAVRISGLVHKKVSHKEVLSVESVQGETVAERVFKSLLILLNKPVFKDAHVEFVLSAQFARLRVAKWNANLSLAEQKSLLRHQFSEVYGSDELNSEVFISDSGYGNNQLAFAVDNALYASLSGIVKQGLAKSISLTPYFVKITNFWHRSIDEKAWLILVDYDSFYIAMVNGNSWQLIKSYPRENKTFKEIALEFSRETLRMGDVKEALPVFLHEVGDGSQADFSFFNNDKQKLVVLCKKNQLKVDKKLMFSAYEFS